MNIHHKNMRQVTEDMQQWIQTNLESYGVFDVVYCHLDLKKQNMLTIPTHLSWHNAYTEQGLTHLLPKRLTPGIRSVPAQNPLYQAFANHFKETPFHKLDVVKKYDNEYELLSVTCIEEIQPELHHKILASLHELSYEACKITKYKPNIRVPLELHTHDFESAQEPSLKNQYQKSKFGDLVLTAKEMQYIEYMLRNKTHQEIALLQDCSNTAVRHIYLNIRRKLGCESMPIGHMAHKLDQLGVLNVCSANFSH
jgi:DNA-binding CsgD family transcriptional regulator